MKTARFIAKLGLISLLGQTQLHAEPKNILGERFVPRSQWDNTGVAPDVANMTKHTTDIAIAVLGHTVMGSGIIAEAMKKSLEGLSAEEITKEREERIENEKQIVKNILIAHTKKDGPFKFSDIAGHGFITPSGLYIEGRDESMMGSHTRGSNDGSLGLYFVGCYHSKGCEKEGYAVNEVTSEMIDTAARTMAYYSVKFGLDIEKQLANPAFSKENQENIAFWPRNNLDIAKDRGERFPYSPGDLIIEKLPEMLEKALTYKAEYLAAEASAKSKASE